MRIETLLQGINERLTAPNVDTTAHGDGDGEEEDAKVTSVSY